MGLASQPVLSEHLVVGLGLGLGLKLGLGLGLKSGLGLGLGLGYDAVLALTRMHPKHRCTCVGAHDL